MLNVMQKYNFIPCIPAFDYVVYINLSGKFIYIY